MDLFEAIAARHSYRGMYQPTPVPREDLQRIMQAALDAPSGCNLQTTRLVAVDDPTLVAELGAMLGRANFASAPAAVCVLTRENAFYRGRSFHVQDYAAAIQNALLAIAGLGYASCWVEGYVTNDDQIGRKMADRLGVPQSWSMVAYLPVGVPTEPVSGPQKQPFEQRAWFNRYGAED